MSLAIELRRLREEDPDVALLLETFSEIDQIYRDALEAMGAIHKDKQEVRNSADVTILFSTTLSSTD